VKRAMRSRPKKWQREGELHPYFFNVEDAKGWNSLLIRSWEMPMPVSLMAKDRFTSLSPLSENFSPLLALFRDTEITIAPYAHMLALSGSWGKGTAKPCE